MSPRPWIRRLFARTPARPITRPGRKLGVESLEDRAVPATFTVNSLLDNGSAGTLRWAVAQANANAGADDITFAPGLTGGTIALTSSPAVGVFQNPVLELTQAGGPVTISGAVTVQGVSNNSAFVVNGTAAIDGLTVTAGGSAVSVGSNGNLTLTNAAVGGGQNTVDVFGSATLRNSTVSAFLNGVVARSGSSVQMTNVTVSGAGGNGVGVIGGAVALRNSTVAGNTGNGVFLNGGSVSLTNTLVVANGAGQVSGAYTDGGGNLVGLPNGFTLAQVVQVGADGKPLLASNGGPTRTIALAAGSPAIAAGVASAVTTDQRGLARNSNPDVGAFETQVPTLTVTTPGGVYDGTPKGVTVSAAGPYGPLAGTTTVAYTTAGGAAVSGTPRNAGSYTAAVTFTAPGYRTATRTVSFTIDPRPLDVKAVTVTKKVNTTDPPLTYTATGLVPGDQLGGALTRSPGEVLGTGYPITQGTLSAGPNYAVTFTPGVLLVVETNAQVTYTETKTVTPAGPATLVSDLDPASPRLEVTTESLDGDVSVTSFDQSPVAAAPAALNARGIKDLHFKPKQPSTNLSKIKVTMVNRPPGKTVLTQKPSKKGNKSLKKVRSLDGLAVQTNAAGTASFDITNSTSINLSDLDGTFFTDGDAEADSLVVTTAADVDDPFDGVTSLREALEFAEARPGPDTITFAPNLAGATITLTPDLGPLTLTDGATTTIDGGTGGVTLDGGNATRLFQVNTGASGALNRLTLRNGLADNGGGVFNAGTLTVTASTLVGNSGVIGGGIFNELTGTLTVTASTLSGNSGVFGGGIFNGGTLTVTGSTLSGNSAVNNGDGGGIYNSGNLKVSASTLAGNTSRRDGGGIYNVNGAVAEVSASTLVGNAATFGDGGGIYSSGNLSVMASTLAGNTSWFEGGGIFSRGSMAVSASTLAGNSARYGGGGIADYGTGTAVNTLVVGNTADGTPDDAPTLSSSAAAGNLIGVPAGYTLGQVVQVGTDGKPLLADNGGPTQTIALVPGSPAVNRGQQLGDPAADQRGTPRDTRPDIGAFEFTAFQPSLVVTTLADEDDGTSDPLYGTGTSLREAVAYANANPGADTITFAPGLAGQTFTLTRGQLTLADPAVTTIDGGPAGLTVSGNNQSRVFAVTGGAALSRLTVTGGNGGGLAVESGGALLLTNSTVSGNSGGGLFVSAGPVTLVNSIVSGNSATLGGGLQIVGGTVTLTNSTVSSNTAYSGGGLSVLGGEVALTNSTVSGNTALFGHGGGLFVSGGSVTLANTTVSGNSAPDNYGQGGGLSVLGGTVIMGNTLVVGNTGPNGPEVAGNITDGGGNLIGVPAGYTLGQVVQVDADGKPLLADNGGPTRTIALVSGSPAVGAGLPLSQVTTDQRGLARNASPDIGAFETQVPAVTVTTPDAVYTGSPYAALGVTVTGPYGVLPPSAGTLDIEYFNRDTGISSINVPPTDAGRYWVYVAFTPTLPGYRPAEAGRADLTITRATPAVAVTSGDAVYTAAAYAAAATLTGVSGVAAALDGVGLTYTYYAGALTLAQTATATALPSAPVNVGTYTVVARFAGSTNYAPAAAAGTFHITPATATVTADADPSTPAQDPFTRVYGDADPDLTYRVSGLLGGDQLSHTLARTGDANAGTYAVTQGNLSAGPNYVIAFTGTAFTITPRAATWTTNPAGKTYGDADPAPLTTGSGTNFLATDGVTATYTRVAGENVVAGGYAITAALSSATLTPELLARNYTITIAVSTFTIVPRVLTVAAAAGDKVYDGGTTASATLTLGNAAFGETPTATFQTATFGDKTAGTGKTVTVTGIALAPAFGTNYTLGGVTTVTATAAITPRPLVVTATGVDKVYDGTTAAAVTLSDNRLTGDLFTVSYTSVFADPNVGTGKPVAVTGIALAGPDAGNYAPNATTTTTASITPATVSVGLTTDRPVTVPGLATTFTATVTGPATVVGTVTFRDGTTVLGTAPVVDGVARLATDALQYGSRTISATFAGSNFTPGSASTGVSVVPAAVLPDPVSGGNALFVGGTPGDDKIEVKGLGNNRYAVEVEAGYWEFEQTFTGPVARVVAYGGAGNDEIEAKADIRVPVFLFGGAGNDELEGAETAPNVLVGGAGNDVLEAGNARDILVGGDGADRLEAKGGDDLLIAGRTAFDADETALWGISLEWNSARDFATRVANLRGTGTGPRANANAFLRATGPTTTVFDDGAGDYLKGGSGRDWYFANATGGGVLDTIAGLKGDDLVDDLP